MTEKNMQTEEKSLFEFTVKAVVVNHEGKCLILSRSDGDKTAPNRFDLPGGRIEEGETIDGAIKREVTEEVGIKIEVGPAIHYLDWSKERNGKIIFCKGLRLLAFHKKGEVKISEEHSNFEWLNFDDAISKFSDQGFEADKRVSLIKAKEYIEFIKSMEGWKRCQADFENYKKDQAKHQEEFRKYAKMDVIEQILPVVDNFAASLAHVPEHSKENKWVEGIVYIKKQLEDVLKNSDIEEIAVKAGDKFDPEIHHAVGGDGEKQKVARVIQKGYKLNGRVLRAARVEVS
ncbi:MAG TPA: nucleotide exchange factor GrpE [Candidatus Bathyarchaeia archaeon]|nr:nucleotide exchange factor GrpE [Candidatus Bathyarchaeia archaeon]